MSDLQKLFVLVPSTSNATVESIKGVSKDNNKVYFMAKFNQIVAKGTVYGVDPSTGKELESLVSVLGGTKGADGSVTVDFSNLNYYTSEGTKTIIGAIEAIDAKIKAEMDKLAASKTLNDNYEFSGQIKYVAASGSVAAHIALVDEAGTELSTVPVADIIGNGVLKKSAYDAATGILTLTFAQADGSEKAVEVDLKAMLDINDIAIDSDSANYLGVKLGTADEKGEQQALFSAKIVKVSEATDAKTGLVDAKDVKAYVDSKATDLAITAEGDAYVGASVNAVVDKKHVIVDANVQNVTYTAGTHATYNTEGGVATAAVPAEIAGVANSLVDGAQATTAIKSYVDFVAAEEALRADAKVLAAVKGLDKASATVDGTNVHVKYKEEDGIVTVEQVTEDYATVTRKSSTSSAATPVTDAAITVTKGDEAKLIKASDLASVATYAAEKVTEEAHRVDKKIAKTISDLKVPAQEKGNNVKVTISETAGKVALDSVVENYATVTYATTDNKANLTVANGDYLVVGNDIASVKQYVDAHVAESVAAKNVSAEGDNKYITASAADNTVTVKANIGAFTYSDGKISGVADKLIDGGAAASAINSYVGAVIAQEVSDRNKAIDDAIKALDVASYTTGDGNVVISYSETDGKVAVSASVNYATVTYEAASGENAAKLTVSNDTQLATGAHIKSVKDYVDAHVTEAVAALDSSITELDASEFVTVTTAIANGKLNADASSVAVVYASHTKDDAQNANKSSYTNGVATGAFVNAVLGDLWETYTA